MRAFALAFGAALGACAPRAPAAAPPPRPPVVPRTPDPQRGLIWHANRDLAAGRWVSAKRRAEEALARDPNDADAYAVLGAAYWRADDEVASTAAFRAALVRDHDNFGGVIALARNLHARGDHTGALTFLGRLDSEEPDLLLMRLRCEYALLDVDAALTTLDRALRQIDLDDPHRPYILAHAGFFRPLAARGPFVTITGERGASDLQLAPAFDLRHSRGVVSAAAASETTRVVLFDSHEEAWVDRAVAERLALPRLGGATPFGGQAELGVTVIPRLAFGDLVLHDIPAYIDDLGRFEVEGPAGVILGRQALRRIGAITFDLRRARLELQATVPTAPPPGATVAPLLILDTYSLLAPATTLSIDGSSHTFYSLLDGRYGSSYVVTRKSYLKSGHLPRTLAEPDDPHAGLHMIYVERARIGDLALGGGGGLVILGAKPDEMLDRALRGAGFELGGALNAPFWRRIAVTYLYARGELHLRP